MSWLRVTTCLPKSGKQVRVVYADGAYRAQYLGRWIAARTVLRAPDEDDLNGFVFDVAEGGVEYWPEGWYLDGFSDSDEVLIQVPEDKITHWQPIDRLPEL